MQAQAFQEFAAFLGGQLGDLGLDGSGHDDGAGAFLRGFRLHGGGEGVALGGGGFVHVADIQNGLRGQQLQAADGLFLALGDGGAGGAAVLQRRDQGFHDGDQGRTFLVAAAGAFLRGNQAFFQAFQVRQHQLGLDHVGIAQRIDGAFDMRHVAVLEAAQDVDDGVDLADIGQELVAQALTLGGTADQAGDIDEFQRCRHDFHRLADDA